jgi:hypothetical protein
VRHVEAGESCLAQRMVASLTVAVVLLAAAALVGVVALGT